MGDMARLQTADRFCKAFKDQVDSIAQVGQTFKSTAVALGKDDSGNVGVYMMLEPLGGGDQHEIVIDGTQADICHMDPDSLVTWASSIFNVDEDEARRRLVEAEIIEENEPESFFTNPQSDRTKLFLSQILGH